MTRNEPYYPVKQNTKKEVWIYEEPNGLQIQVADEKGKAGPCVGVITWKYLEGAMRRHNARK